MTSYHSLQSNIIKLGSKFSRVTVWRRLVLVGLMSVIAVLVLVSFHNRFHSFYFQDETDHVTVGWMMWRFDKQLYRDLSTNHMPIPILLGAGLSRLLPADTLYQLVSGLRQSMWLIWTIFALFATWRFRSAGAISFTFLLLLNFYYFGFHVLTDPLAAMGIAIMTLYLVTSRWQRQKLSAVDGLIYGVLAGLTSFSLLSVWPFVILTTLLICFQQSHKFYVSVLAGVLAVVIVVFGFVSPSDWWRETVINNVVYVVKDQANFSSSEKLGLILFPLTVVTQPTSQQAMLIFGLFVTICWLWRQWWISSPAKNRTKILTTLATVIVLISLNTRVPHSMYVFYRGIHAMPYLAGLTALLGGLFVVVRPKLSSAQKIAVSGLILFLVTFTGRFMSEKLNHLNEYYIQYGEYASTGEALSRLKNPGDSLMTGPDGYGYINQMADLPLFGKQNFHLSWSFYVPYLHDYFFTQFAQRPPTFVFVRPGGDPHYQAILPQLKTQYVRLKRQISTSDIEMYELYMLKSEVNKRSSAQWQAFQNIGFKVPAEYLGAVVN